MTNFNLTYEELLARTEHLEDAVRDTMKDLEHIRRLLLDAPSWSISGALNEVENIESITDDMYSNLDRVL